MTDEPNNTTADAIRPRLALRQIARLAENALALTVGNEAAAAAMREILSTAQRGIAFRRPQSGTEA